MEIRGIWFVGQYIHSYFKPTTITDTNGDQLIKIIPVEQKTLLEYSPDGLKGGRDFVTPLGETDDDHDRLEGEIRQISRTPPDEWNVRITKTDYPEEENPPLEGYHETSAFNSNGLGLWLDHS